VTSVAYSANYTRKVNAFPGKIGRFIKKAIAKWNKTKKSGQADSMSRCRNWWKDIPLRSDSIINWPNMISRARLHMRICWLRPVLSAATILPRSEEHTSELQSRENLVCRPLLEKKKER